MNTPAMNSAQAPEPDTFGCVRQDRGYYRCPSWCGAGLCSAPVTPMKDQRDEAPTGLTELDIAAAMLEVDDPLLWGRLGADNRGMVTKFAKAIERRALLASPNSARPPEPAAPDDWIRVGDEAYVSRRAVLALLKTGEFIFDKSIQDAYEALATGARETIAYEHDMGTYIKISGSNQVEGSFGTRELVYKTEADLALRAQDAAATASFLKGRAWHARRTGCHFQRLRQSL